MSHFILYKWRGKKFYYLWAGLICALTVAAAGCAAYHIGTAGAKSRETIVIDSGETLEQYLLDQDSDDYNLNGRYRLESDLELDWLYQSIGTNVEPFTGKFDGNGHVISGLMRPLFGVIRGAEVENLFLNDAVIETPFTYYDGEQYVDGYGALAAYAADSVIKNCGVSGEILIASPSEAEYLLEKASPSEAEERKGPGVLEPSDAVPAAGEQESSQQSSEVKGPGVESNPADESGEESSGESETTDTAMEPESTSAVAPEESASAGAGEENADETGTTGESTRSQETEDSSGSDDQSEKAEEPETGDEAKDNSNTEAQDQGKPKPEESGTEASDSHVSKPETPDPKAPDPEAPDPKAQDPEAPDPEASGQETPNIEKAESEAPVGQSVSWNMQSWNTQSNNTQSKNTQSGNTPAETAVYKPVLRQRLMKTPPVIGPGAEELMTATPPEAEELPLASPSDAEQADSKTDDNNVDSLDKEPEYIGNPEGDLYILVTAECIRAGGLVSEIGGETLISDCFALVTIGSEEPGVPSSTGGLAAMIGEDGRVENSYASGLADTTDVIGGLAAVNNGMIQNCYTTMVIGESGTTRGAFTAMGTGGFSGCIYDRQISCTEAEGEETSDSGEGEFEVRGLDTLQISGTAAQIPGTWYVTEHAYPQLEYFAANENGIIASCSKMSAVALVLPEGTNLKDALTEKGPVLPAAIDGEEIQWELDGAGFIDEENRVQMKQETVASISRNETPVVKASLDGTEPEINTEEPAVDDSSSDTEESRIQLRATMGDLSRSFTLRAAPRAGDGTYTTWGEVGEAIENGTLPGYKPTKSADGYYEIGTPEAFAWFSYAVNYIEGYAGINGRLTGDLNLLGTDNNWTTSSLVWIPIGQSQTIPYTGNFDGGMHKISNLTITGLDDIDILGLFGNIDGSSINGIILENATVAGTSSGGGNVGGIIGTASGAYRITNCGVESGTIKGRGTSGGVLCTSKSTSGIISRCYNKAKIEVIATEHTVAGGVVGRFPMGFGTRCYNQGSVSANTGIDTHAGGVFGWTYSDAKSTAEYSYNTGTVTARNDKYAVIESRGSVKAVENFCLTGRGNVRSGVTALSDEALKTWYLAYRLNGNTLDGGYTYNTGDYPSFGMLETGDWEKVGEGLYYDLFSENNDKPAGTGQADDPFQILNAEQLAWFAYKVNREDPALCAKLMSDINLRGDAYGGTEAVPIRWIPIGTSAHPFTGTFDGNGKQIHNMNVEQKGAAGLFGYVGGGAVIRKLGLAPTCRVKNISENDTEEAGTASFAGAVISNGTNAGVTIENCYNRGSVQGRTARKTGGIAGSCTADGSLQRIANCYTTGLITVSSGSGEKPGAIAGTFAVYNAGTGAGISYCAWDRQTSSVGDNLGIVSVGGAIGYMTGSLYTIEMNTSLVENPSGLLERLNTGLASNIWLRSEKMNDGYPIISDICENWGEVGALEQYKPSCKIPANTATEGEAANPYLIYTEEELAWFAYQVNHNSKPNLSAELMADIRLFGEFYTGSTYVAGDMDRLSWALCWVPIGSETSPYTGTFQGNDHLIFCMKSEGTKDQGLFGVLGAGAQVSNVQVSDSLVSASEAAGGVGGIVGRVSGAGVSVTSCGVKGKLTLKGDKAGGIAGFIDTNGTNAVIQWNWNAGNIDMTAGGDSKGGILGRCEGAGLLVEGCYTLMGSQVNAGESDGTGGIAGHLSGGSGQAMTIRNCYNKGIVTGGCAGGIVGGKDNNTAQSVTGCYNVGNVTANYFKYGKIVGSNTPNGVANCWYDQEWAGNANGGGVNGTGLPAKALKSWAAAYGLNGYQRSQSTGISWTYDPAGIDYPVPTTESLPIPSSWLQIGEGLEYSLLGSGKTKPGGSGQQGTPYEISTAEQLAWLTYIVNQNNGSSGGAHAVLTADINLFGGEYTDVTDSADLEHIDQALPWKPIGGSGSNYRGTFDGNGHQIDGMYLQGNTQLGLFGEIQYPAEIRELGIGRNSKVVGSGDCALLVGNVRTVSAGGAGISNCYNLGTLTATGSDSGAFVGNDIDADNYLSVTISNCYNAGNTSGFAMVSSGTVQRSYADIMKNSSNNRCIKKSGDGVSGLTTDEMKTNETVDGLNTTSAGLQVGTDRIWYTSLDSENTIGYPTLLAPVTAAVVFEPDTPEAGRETALPGNLTIADMKLRSFQSVDSNFTPGSTAATGTEFTQIPYTDVTGADSGYHKYGCLNANQKLAFKAGGTDLYGQTSSLNRPATALHTVSSISLGQAAAYTKQEDRYLLLEGASENKRYEIQITVKGVTSKILSVMMPVEVTMAQLTPDGTEHVDHSVDLNIQNRNAYPVDAKIVSVKARDDNGYVVLKPVAKSVELPYNREMTSELGGVRLGLSNQEGASSPLTGDVYYDPETVSEKAWLEYRLKYSGTLPYRYFMEYNGFHFSNQADRFAFDINYGFAVSEQDYTDTADVIVTR